MIRSRSDCLSQPPVYREPKRMAPPTSVSATRSRQKLMAAGSGSGWMTAGNWLPMRCRLTGRMASSPAGRDAGSGC